MISCRQLTIPGSTSQIDVPNEASDIKLSAYWLVDIWQHCETFSIKIEIWIFQIITISKYLPVCVRTFPNTISYINCSSLRQTRRICLGFLPVSCPQSEPGSQWRPVEEGGLKSDKSQKAIRNFFLKIQFVTFLIYWKKHEFDEILTGISRNWCKYFKILNS